MASPHTRGWTRAREQAARRGEGFPAHAGMDPTCPCPGRPAGRLPRTRGDGPRPRGAASRPRGASPHTRGWTPVPIVHGPIDGGFPAHAGMDPAIRSSAASSGRLPRTRGDGPDGAVRPGAGPGASPHTRGWTRLPRAEPLGVEGFPAHAGMDPAPWATAWSRSWLPRTRGDGPDAAALRGGRVTASPHTRGWTPPAPAAGWRLPGFPAHAGMDRRRARA